MFWRIVLIIFSLFETKAFTIPEQLLLLWLKWNKNTSIKYILQCLHTCSQYYMHINTTEHEQAHRVLCFSFRPFCKCCCAIVSNLTTVAIRVNQREELVVSPSIQHFGPQQYISTTAFTVEVHSPQRKIQNDFGVPLTFPTVPYSGQMFHLDMRNTHI